MHLSDLKQEVKFSLELPYTETSEPCQNSLEDYEAKLNQLSSNLSSVLLEASDVKCFWLQTWGPMFSLHVINKEQEEKLKSKKVQITRYNYKNYVTFEADPPWVIVPFMYTLLHIEPEKGLALVEKAWSQRGEVLDLSDQLKQPTQWIVKAELRALYGSYKPKEVEDYHLWVKGDHPYHHTMRRVGFL